MFSYDCFCLSVRIISELHTLKIGYLWFTQPHAQHSGSLALLMVGIKTGWRVRWQDRGKPYIPKKAISMDRLPVVNNGG